MLELGGSKEYFRLRVREDFLQEAAFKLGYDVQLGHHRCEKVGHPDGIMNKLI